MSNLLFEKNAFKKISFYLFFLNSYLISHGIIITDETFYNGELDFIYTIFKKKIFNNFLDFHSRFL